MADSSANPAVIFVNPIEIPADQVDRFLAGWEGRAEFMRHQPGFRDYRLMRAMQPDSRFQLINVARWDSMQAFVAASAEPEFQAQLRALNDNPDFDVTGNPGLFQVALEASAATAEADRR